MKHSVPESKPQQNTTPTLPWLLDLIGEVLALPQNRLSADRSFQELGVNSLLAVRLVDRINRTFDLLLGVEVLFSYGDPQRLARHLDGLRKVDPKTSTAIPISNSESPEHPVKTTVSAVAVVGYAGRFAKAQDPEALWTSLMDGEVLHSEMPRYRLIEPTAPPPRAGFLSDAERFDADFFGISPREAAAMDPVQRLFLEQSWCALEHAGLTKARRSNQRIGVYAGASASGYDRTIPVTGKSVDAYIMTGNLASMTAARVAYHLDLEGPAVTLDTACSSSLMAIHIACQALLNGEIDMAIAGGASLFINERSFSALAAAGMTSPSGHCRPFDEQADGIMVGEGVGCVILKRYADALTDGDRVEALIRGSAANQDGRSNGITAPNAKAQSELLQRVLDQHGIDPDTIDLVETHGTGTRLGDPIEISALREVYDTPTRPSERPLRIAAVKSTTGHTSEAAGVLGFLSTLHALRKQHFPPIVGFNHINSHIAPFQYTQLVLSHQSAPWPKPSTHPRRAVVSSFGLSGTNVHLLLEEPPEVPSPKDRPLPPEGAMIGLSAETPDALMRRRQDLAEWLAGQRDSLLPALSRTLLYHRERMTYRWATVASTVEELRHQLRDTETSLDDPKVKAWIDEAAPLDIPSVGDVPPPLALPTYPFRGPRLWGGKRIEEDPPAFAVESTTDSKTDNGIKITFKPEDAIVQDHRIAGEALLHAGVLLDLGARLVAQRSPGNLLTQWLWLKPLVVTQPTTVEVQLEGDLLTITAGTTVYATAEVTPGRCHGRPPEQKDPAALWQELPTSAQIEASTSRIDDIFLGPSYPGPDRIRCCEIEALAFVDQCPKQGAQLPPALIDSALRTAAAAVSFAEGQAMRLRYPAKIERIEHVSILPEEGLWIHARRRRQGSPRSVETLDIDILDRHGIPVLYLEGFHLALAPEISTTQSGQSTDTPLPPCDLYRIDWLKEHRQPQGRLTEEVSLIVADHGDRVADLLRQRFPQSPRIPFDVHETERTEVLQSLSARSSIWFVSESATEAHILWLLRWLKAMTARGLASTPLIIRLVTQGAFSAKSLIAPVHPFAATLQGLGKAAAREMPAWHFRLIDLAADFPLTLATLERVVTEPGDHLGEPVILGGEHRHVQRVIACDDEDTTPPIRLQQGAHIILLGGAGRLGRETARYFAQRYQARLTLVGRRALDPARQTLINDIKRLGGDALYLSADLEDSAQINGMMDHAIATFGPAALLIQSAVDPSFARLERTVESDFMAALTPKVTGLVNVCKALQDRPVGGLLVFSSIGGFAGFPANDGQASYCAACTFEVSQAQSAMSDLGLPTRVIHFGLWQTEEYAPEVLAQLHTAGLQALPLSHFNAVLEKVLETPGFRMIHAGLSPEAWMNLGRIEGASNRAGVEAARASLAFSPQGVAEDTPSDRRAIDHLINQRLARLLIERGLQGTAQLTPSEAILRLTTQDALYPLAEAILQQALRRGWISGNALGWSFNIPTLPLTSPEESVPHPAFKLLARCLDHLPKLLAGDISGSEILFPRGSMEWVEPLYREQPILAACNRRLAQAVTAAVEAGARRIIEVGAGTGSTTAQVLEALKTKGLEERITYCYTDISRAFTRHGESRFGQRIAHFHVLDINRSPAEQGVSLGAWDMVVATNVLHATPNIIKTLEHVNALIAPDGFLLLNEMVEQDDFATLTFGLLEDWWRIEDPDLRLKDGPILSIPGWWDAFRRAGFEGRWAFDHSGRFGASQGGQSILLTAKTATAQYPGEMPSRPSAPSTPPPPAPPSEAGDRTDQSEMENDLRHLLADILAVDAGHVERTRPFQEIGVDSLVAPQIVEEIEASLAIKIRVTDIYKFGNLASLAAHLSDSQSHQVRPLAAPTAQAIKTAPHAIPKRPISSGEEAIAIIGLSVRYPGAPDLEALWDLVMQGGSAISEVTRFSSKEWYDPRGGNDKSYAKWGGFLPEHDCFDPYFFGITPAEAEAMDPQQRVLMEETWKALEHAGIDPESLSGSRCGLFIGASANNYQASEGTPGLRTLGGSMAILSARMAYHLNLHGPAFPIDTGCSSSLVAVHQACQSLRSRECDLALSGGVSVNLLSPDIFLYLADTGMASRTGSCKTFDEQADGFVPGEGVGVLVLKRLSDALLEGDRIEAVLVGSGVNQDGRTAGLTAPSSEAQARLFADIYQRYGLEPGQFGMVEAHGTGTRLGDPIEVQALTEAFSLFNKGRERCAIGSIKTNVGHTMAAAGVAGIAKVILSLQHRLIPPSCHFREANHHIDFASSPFFVPTETTPWPTRSEPIGAVSSFGFSGTNAHVVLQAAPTPSSVSEDSQGPWLFVVSARDGSALKRRLQQLKDYLAHLQGPFNLARMAETLARGRAHGRYRMAMIAGDLKTLETALSAALSAATPEPISQERIPMLQPIHREDPSWLDSVKAAYERGDSIDWFSLFGSRRPPLVLPPYPFARERFWSMADPLSNPMNTFAIPSDHPLLLAHRVGSAGILPGTLALEILRGDASSLSQIEWIRPLRATDTPATLEKTDGFELTLGIKAGPLLVKGTRTIPKAPRPAPPPLDWAVRLSGKQLYERFENAGFDYGEALRVVDWVDISVETGTAQGHLLPPLRLAADPVLVSAALLDGGLQIAASLGHSTSERITHEQWVPSRLETFTVYKRPSGPLMAYAQLNAVEDPDTLSFSVDLRDQEGQVVAAFDGMTARRLLSPEPARSQLYRPDWLPAPHVAEATFESPAHIVLYGHHEALIEALTQRYPKAQWTRLDMVQTPQHLADLLRERPDPLMVLQILSPPMPLESQALTLANRVASLDPLPETLVARHLAQAIILRGSECRTGLMTIALDVEEPAHHLTLKTIAGLYRTLKLEAPTIDARVISVDRGATLDHVAREMDQPLPQDPLIAYSPGSARCVQGWIPHVLPAGMPGKTKGTFLISGGLGGIGLSLAQRLTTQGPVNLALIGRSAPKPEALSVIAALEQQGANILYQSLDLGDARQMAEALARIRSAFGPIERIYHLAGHLSDGYLRGQPDHTLYESFKPKVQGTLLLDLLTRQDDVDDFVLFGSTASVFGSIGQADYSAANAFMSAYAEYRNGLGLRTHAIGWPLWSKGGMLPPDESIDFLRTLGMEPLPMAEGFDLMDRIIGQDHPCTLLLHGHADLFDRLRDPVHRGASTTKPLASDPSPEWAYDYLCQVLMKVTKLPAARIEQDVPFEALGIDSIAIMKMNQQLEDDLGPISKTLFFEFRTPRSLAAHLAQRKPPMMAAMTSSLALPTPMVMTPADAPHRPIIDQHKSPQASPLEDIAIIGVAGIYPDAENIDIFWDRLLEGHDAIQEIPKDRWPLEGFYDEDRQRSDTSHCKWGGFIAHPDHFDCRFFGISPIEAETIDPQARKFMEVCWNALEDAGIDPDRMFESLPEPERTRRLCGIFVGVMSGDYQLYGPEEAAKGNLVGPNADYWNIANRVSAFLDLHGPSLAVDTACSSSLTALHLACQSLRTGECDLAIAGGVNLCLHPRRHWILSKAGMIASDGRCHSFGDGGDGYVPGEGIGAVVLKPLSRAIGDKDRILGIIRGSAINHGGRTSGYTVPNPVAQGDAISLALERSGVDPKTISYIEAHGTGTPLGDPIEIRGLARGFSNTMPKDIAIGSLKSNIGHLESAAGIAGLTKVLLQMREAILVPSLHAIPPNPGLDFEGTNFRIVSAIEPWRGPEPLRAGVSSFGAGGANAHLIVESPPPEPFAGPALSSQATVALLLSAPDPEALRRRAGQLARYLNQPAERVAILSDIAYTLAQGRKAFGWRLAVVGKAPQDIAQKLFDFVDREIEPPGLLFGEAAPSPHEILVTEPMALAEAWIRGGRAPTLSGRRIALPGYPFAKRRIWIHQLPRISAEQVKPFHSRNFHFSADDTWFRDHRIAGKEILPGAVSLSLAVESAGETLLKGQWLAPGLPSPEGLELTLRWEERHIVIQSTDGVGLFSAQTGENHPVPLAPSKLRNTRDLLNVIEGDAVYSLLASVGAEYGPSLRMIDRVYRGDGLAIARLIEGASRVAILDASFQLCFALIPPSLAGLALLPQGFEAFKVVGSLQETAWVIASLVSSDEEGMRLDLQFNDLEEKPVALLEGMEVRAPKRLGRPSDSSPALPPLRVLRPDWIPMVKDPGWIPTRAWILSEKADDPVAIALARDWSGTLAALQDQPDQDADAVALVIGGQSSSPLDAAVRLETLLQPLLPTLRDFAAREKPPALLILSRETQDLGQDAAATGLSAFVRATVRERSDWPLVSLDLPYSFWSEVESDHALPEAITAALPRPGQYLESQGVRRLQDSLVLKRMLTPITLPPWDSPWKDGEVLVIAGSGGLGNLLARRASQCARVKVILLGRQKTPNRTTEETLVRLGQRGLSACYLQADLADPLALRQVSGHIQAEFGQVDWLVHTALQLEDAPIGKLDLPMIRRVLAPKTFGLAHLTEAVNPLRGLIVFSSSNALTTNPGQGAYAAASAFIDTLSMSLPVPVHVIDWGYWGETGAVADSQHETQLARIGVFSIRNEEGLDYLERIIGAGLDRAAVLRVADDLLIPLGVRMESQMKWRGSSRHPEWAESAFSALMDLQSETQGFERPDTSMLDQFAAQRLWLALTELGVPIKRGAPLNPKTLRQALSAPEAYHRLLVALIDLLQRWGFIDADGHSSGIVLSRDPLEAARHQLEQAVPAARPTLHLLEKCCNALGEVVAGSRDAVSVLFEGGQADTVAEVYTGNPVLDHFHGLVATAVSAIVARDSVDLSERKVEILEVGAGTGATTRPVLDALKGLPGWTYRLTDISAGLAAATSDHLDPERRFLKSGKIDICRPLQDQGILPASIDIIIAANVLHATPNLVAVLEHLKEALVPGGLLILNEATTHQDVNTLTFGLTPGWWAAEDDYRRCPNGPLLTPSLWRQTLLEVGFNVKAMFGLPLTDGNEHPLQTVILAVADSLIPDRVLIRKPEGQRPMKTESKKSGTTDIERTLHHIITETLRLEPHELGMDDSFADHGADSILSVELVRRINSALGIDLKSTALFNYATVRELAQYLVMEHGLGHADEDRQNVKVTGKGQAKRLIDVINRRRAAAPINREDAFWAREGASDPTPQTETGTLSLERLLEALERGELTVDAALEYHHD